MRRDPQLFVTSAMAEGAEAHSRIAPKKLRVELFGDHFLSQEGLDH
jgi:hypothetical protein